MPTCIASATLNVSLPPALSINLFLCRKLYNSLFLQFPYVDNDCNYQVADLFAVDIDLDTKRFVKAKLDDINLNAKETVILLWFNTIAAQHVKLHAMANWGVNVDEALADVNPFFRQSSVVTVMYK